jgi:hypothetical protein
MLYVMILIGIVILLTGKLPIGIRKTVGRPRTTLIGLLLIAPIPLSFLYGLVNSSWLIQVPEDQLEEFSISYGIYMMVAFIVLSVIIAYSTPIYAIHRKPKINLFLLGSSISPQQAAQYLDIPTHMVLQLINRRLLESIDETTQVTRKSVFAYELLYNGLNYAYAQKYDEASELFKQALKIPTTPVLVAALTYALGRVNISETEIESATAFVDSQEWAESGIHLSTDWESDIDKREFALP